MAALRQRIWRRDSHTWPAACSPRPAVLVSEARIRLVRRDVRLPRTRRRIYETSEANTRRRNLARPQLVARRSKAEGGLRSAGKYAEANLGQALGRESGSLYRWAWGRYALEWR